MTDILYHGNDVVAGLLNLICKLWKPVIPELIWKTKSFINTGMLCEQWGATQCFRACSFFQLSEWNWRAKRDRHRHRCRLSSLSFYIQRLQKHQHLREREREIERGRTGMTGTGCVLTAVSFMRPVTISSCFKIRETERGEMGRNREFYSCKVCEV